MRTPEFLTTVNEFGDFGRDVNDDVNCYNAKTPECTSLYGFTIPCLRLHQSELVEG